MSRAVVGIHRDLLTIVPIGRVANGGLKCNCICHDCKEPLEAVLNGPTRPYFRHSKRSNCNPSPETGLHLMAKRILLENDQLLVPGLGLVNYTEPMCEVFFDRLRPDVTLLVNGDSYYVEIVVTNTISAAKRDAYQATGANVLVIDLRDVERDITIEELESLVLNEPDLRSVLAYKDPKRMSISEENGLIVFVALIGLALFAGKYLIDLFGTSPIRMRRSK